MSSKEQPQPTGVSKFRLTDLISANRVALLDMIAVVHLVGQNMDAPVQQLKYVVVNKALIEMATECLDLDAGEINREVNKRIDHYRALNTAEVRA